MSKFKATDEQLQIFNYVKNRKDNLIIEARAGSGKTTTIVQACRFLPKDKEITFLAFNKHIRDELAEKLPKHVRCYTTYSIGLGALKRKYPNIEMDEFKVDKLLAEHSTKWGLSAELPNAFDREGYLSALKKFINLCRLTLTMDKKWMLILAERYEIQQTSDNDIKRVSVIMEKLMNDRKTYDFEDMVFIPAIDPKVWFFPQDYVIVDEIQDLNRAQQKIIEKLLKKDAFKKVVGRLIGVGDEFQSIYGFTGVSGSTFDWFRKRKDTQILPLTYTFRCGKDIVTEANKIVADIKALPDAHKGLVRIDGDVLVEPQSGDFILCRTTLPLVKLFFKFLLDGKKAMIKGRDVGISLIEMTTGHKTINKLVASWTNELENYRVDLRKKRILNYDEHSGYVSLRDKVNALVFLAGLSKDIPDLREKIAKIFTDEISGIVLSTVHKAKGLEADRVFIVRPDLLPMPAQKGWQYAQELNLKYVAVTRAKRELIFDYNWTDEEEDKTAEI